MKNINYQQAGQKTIFQFFNNIRKCITQYYNKIYKLERLVYDNEHKNVYVDQS